MSLGAWRNGLRTRHLELAADAECVGGIARVDFDSFSHMRLYRASDRLLRHRAALEEHLFSAVHTLFALERR